MLDVYIGCLVFGVLFAIVSVLLGDVLSTALDGVLDFLSADYLNPTVLATAITVFGGAGILLTHYSVFGRMFILILSLLAALTLGAAVQFLYVRPMQESENSTGYSVQGLAGRLGEVITPIPAKGYGEVIVKVGASNTNQIAASFDQREIQAGDRVVVVEVRDGVLYVSRFENN